MLHCVLHSHFFFFVSESVLSFGDSIFYVADSNNRFTFSAFFYDKGSFLRIRCGHTLYFWCLCGWGNTLYSRVLAACALQRSLFRWSKIYNTTEDHERARAGLLLKWKEHSQMDFSFLCCLVGHPQSVVSRSQTWSSDQGRCQISHTAVITEFYFQVGSSKHQQKHELLTFS